MVPPDSTPILPGPGRVTPLPLRRRRPENTRPEVPDHEILRKIGTGAYGEVWLARSVTGAYRAVKVVWREDFAEEQVFIREFDGVLNYEPIARSITGLVHILHVGQHGGDFPYYFYVMELADDSYTGIHIHPEEYTPRTLYSDMQQYGNRPMPLDYVLEAGCQLARALVGLHAHELTHRDVKPTNVVFVNGRLKLADAGLVANSGERCYVGTEGYIPPEGPGSPRADVYALAKVLYEMATGKDRLHFPELPDELPEGCSRQRWQAFNDIICAAADPQMGKNTIVSAKMMAEHLEALRDDRPLHRKKKSLPLRYKVLFMALFFGMAAAVATHFLPEDINLRLRRAVQSLRGISEQAPEPKPTPPPVQRTALAPGQFFIGSVPSGASVYTEEGVYLDETPYGPISAEAGTRAAFVLKKEGYADSYVSGIIPEGGLLSLGGDLLPYRPPQTGRHWQDAMGTSYRPAGGVHEAISTVSAAQFREFLQANPNAAEQYPHEMQGNRLKTTQDGIGAYTLWLTRLCEKEGIIGSDHSLQAIPEPGTATEKGLSCYRLRTTLVQKTPVSIYTNPAGASVMLNGRPLGVTPIQEVRIPQAPYYIEIRLPGYSTIRRSGLSPKGMVLNLPLEQNHSVVFGSEWINSLGLKLQPITPYLMATATEIRVRDYLAFCSATGTPDAPIPVFEQNEHHPVVNITRAEAEAFAQWLTQKEQEAGLLERTDTYRLPTDAEWSLLAGCQDSAGNTPYERQRRRTAHSDQYPWGTHWPPTRNTGNFADGAAIPARRADQCLPNYYDGFAYTSPVGSFPANHLGLHDIAGNVQEWVSCAYGGPENFRFRQYGVTRGGSFNSFRPRQLSSAARTPQPPDTRRPTIGFRLVLERKLPQM